MPTDFPLPPAGAEFEVRGNVLRYSAAREGICELRVDEGIAFVRFPGRQDGSQWQDASQHSVFAAFTAESPIATFLRTHGIDPLRQFLTGISAPIGSPPGSSE